MDLGALIYQKGCTNGLEYSGMLVRDENQMNQEEELEAVMFSRTAVTNSLLMKLIPPKPETKTPIDQLDKRLSLLAH